LLLSKPILVLRLGRESALNEAWQLLSERLQGLVYDLLHSLSVPGTTIPQLAIVLEAIAARYQLTGRVQDLNEAVVDQIVPRSLLWLVPKLNVAPAVEEELDETLDASRVVVPSSSVHERTV